MSGWVKLHRKIMSSDIWADASTLKVWIWCLIKASHKDRSIPVKKGDGSSWVDIKPGQFVTSINNPDPSLNMGKKRFRKIIDTLEKLEQISTKRDKNGTIISVCNWGTYQERKEKDPDSGENNGEKKGDNKGDNNRVNNGEKKGDTNNNVKNDKNEKKVKKPDPDSISRALEVVDHYSDTVKAHKMDSSPSYKKKAELLLKTMKRSGASFDDLKAAATRYAKGCGQPEPTFRYGFQKFYGPTYEVFRDWLPGSDATKGGATESAEEQEQRKAFVTDSDFIAERRRVRALEKQQEGDTD